MELLHPAKKIRNCSLARTLISYQILSGGHQGLDAAGGDAMTKNRQEATATFILGPEAPLPIALLLRPGYTGLELGVEGRLKVSDGLKLFFGCARRGDLGLACNW
jgi:hypothetical protein